MNIEHPPFAKKFAAFPLLFLNLSPPQAFPNWYKWKEWEFSEEFIYHNKVDADKIVNISRIFISFFSLILGYFVFLFSKKLYGYNCGIVSLLLYIVCPNILAHAPLVNTDLASSCFIFISVFTFYCFLLTPNLKNIFLVGLSLSLALGSKFTTIIIFPIFFLILIFQKNWTKYIGKIIIIIFIAMFFLLSFYSFTGLDNYFLGLRRIILEASKHGHATFLCGKYSNTGWRYYYLVAFLIKTSIPVLIFILLRIFISKSGSEVTSHILLIPIILIFLSASFSKKQIGLRYILPIYPFLYVWISKIWISKPVLTDRPGNVVRGLKNKILTVVLIGFHIFSSLKTSPHYLSYFNEIVGGPDNGWKYLADSNIDWGQDLKALKNYIIKENVSDVILSYFGTANPNYYLIKFQDLATNSIIPRIGQINQLNPEKEILAISVNNLLGVYFYDRNVFKWLRERKPDKKIGYSIFVYDITKDITAHEYLAQIYFESNWIEEAKRECERLLILDPNNSIAHFTLACIFALESNQKLARVEYQKVKVSISPLTNHLLNYWNYNLGVGKKVEPGNYARALAKLKEKI